MLCAGPRQTPEIRDVPGRGNANLQHVLAFFPEAKRIGAVLLIAKLDRLARSVSFIANLLESGVEVTAADMPEANRFLLHVTAAVAEHEAQAISDRTRAALAAAKARGVALGWSMPERKEEQRQASRKGTAKNAKNACMRLTSCP